MYRRAISTLSIRRRTGSVVWQVAACLLAAIACTSLRAASFYAFDSSGGEPLGQGRSRVLTTADASISAYCSGAGVHVGLMGPGADWTLSFIEGGRNEPMTGVYEHALGYPGQGPRWHGISASANGIGCGGSSGRFVVRELVCGAGGSVTKLALDFEHYCGASPTAPPLLGYVRIDSNLPKIVPQPTASAGLAQRVREGTTVRLDGSKSSSPSGIASVRWAQTAGPTVTLTGGSTLTPQFVAPNVAAGDALLEFELTVSGSNGLSSTDRTTVMVLDTSSPTTVLRLQSDPGEYLGGGATTVITDLYDTLYGGCWPSQAQMYVQTAGPWDAMVRPPERETLQRGVYTPVALSPSESSPLAFLQVHRSHASACGAVYGQFVVHEFVCDSRTGQGRFAIDVVQRCGSPTAPKLAAQLRWQSAVPLTVTKPTASAGMAQFITEGQTVTLDGSRSYSPSGIASLRWSQLSGPTVALSSTTVAKPTFVAPLVPAGGANLTFRILATGQDGQTDFQDIQVQIRAVLDPQTFVTVDYNGIRTLELQSRDSTLGGSCAANRLHLSASRESQSSTTSAHFSLTAPLGQTLRLGAYEQLNWPLPTATRGAVSGTGICDFSPPRVVLRELVCDANGIVSRAAVDAESLCPDTSGAPSKVTWRYNSAIEAPYTKPTASAGNDQHVQEGQSITLDGSKSVAPNGIGSVEWRQVAGTPGTLQNATSLRATFIAPMIASGTETVSLEIVVRDVLGNESVASTGVLVRDSSAPRTTVRNTRSRQANAVADTNFFFSEVDTVFTGQCSAAEQTASVSWNGPTWGFVLLRSEPERPLAPRVYPYASADSTALPRRAWFEYSARGISCSSEGRFVVRDFACNGTVLERLAIDHENDCSNPAAAPFTHLRFNSSVPEFVPQPTANAGVDQSVRIGDVVTLDGSRSFGPLAFAASWTQTSGPTVLLQNAASLNPTFTAPDVGLPGAIVEFELTATAVDGLSSRDTVQVQITSRQAPKSFLTVISQPGDFVGVGNIFTINDFSGFIDTTCSANQAKFSARNRLHNWSVEVRDTATPLTAGSRGTDLYVGGDSRSCSSFAEFDVREYACGADGRLERFAVDVINRCAQTGPVLRAFARLNSTVPLPAPIDRGCRIALLGTQLTPANHATLLLRGLLGVRNAPMMAGLLPQYTNSTPSPSEIESHFNYACALIPEDVGPSDCSMDLDGDGVVRGATDGLLAARLLLGVAPDVAMRGAISTTATRTTWPEIQQYINTCNLLP